jgi:DNA-binding CsgD family transcriptional regulator
MPHFLIFIESIILVMGILAAYHISWQFKLCKLSYLKPYALNILFINLLISVQLISRYLLENYFQNASATGSFNLYFVTRHALGYIASFGIAFTFVQISLGFKEKKMFPLIKTFFYVAFILLTFSFGVGVTLFLQNKNARWLITTKNFVNMGLVLVFVISVIFLLFEGIKTKNKETRKIINAFAFLYLSVSFGMFFCIILDFSFEIVLTLALLLCMNLFPFILFKYFISGSVNKGFSVSCHPSVLKRVVEEFNISNREKEILELLIKGNSNKQIERELFISSHTVKNHIYSLYQKLGIKSRGQLMQFMSKRSL